MLERRRSHVLHNHVRTLRRNPSRDEWSEARERDWQGAARALKIRKAARRLIALGLARGGMSGPRMVIERTEIGSTLVARRHNQLHAIAEHVGEAAPEFVWWEAKRRTRSVSPLPWPRIDSRLLQLIPDIYQLTVFRRAFMFGPLARWLPKERQYDVAKACLDWHKKNMIAMTKNSIRNWLDAELDKAGKELEEGACADDRSHD